MSEPDKRTRFEHHANVLPLKRPSIGRFVWLWRRTGQLLVLIALLVMLLVAVSPRPSEATLMQPPIFMTCNEARAAGLAPAYEGQPGYAPWLDADHDGIACEPYPTNRPRFVRGWR